MLDSFIKFVMKKHFQMGEILLGLFGITWGLWILNPLISVFDIEVLSNIGFLSANDLGVFMLSLGIITFILSHLNKYLFRQMIIFINMFSWWFISILFFLAMPSNPSVAVYAMLGIYSFWQYIKLVVLIFLEKDFIGNVK